MPGGQTTEFISETATHGATHARTIACMRPGSGPPHPSPTRRALRQNLLLRFSVLSFVVMAAIALLFGWMLQQRLIGDALTQQGQEGGALVDALLWSHLTAGQMEHPVRASEYRELRRLVLDIKRSQGAGQGHIVRIKIWNRRGTVFFSDDPRIVGRNFGIDAGLRDALHGRTSSTLSDLSDRENVDDRRFGSPLLQTYVPIRGVKPGSVIGAYEIYHDMKGLQPRIDSIRRFVILGVGGGFLVLYLSLFGLVRGASRRLTLQARENESKAARLATINELTRLVSSNEALDTICDAALNGLAKLTDRRPIIIAIQPHRGDLTAAGIGVGGAGAAASCLIQRVRDASSLAGQPVHMTKVEGCLVSLPTEECACRQMHPWLAWPIHLRDQPIGLIGIRDARSSELGADETAALSELSMQLAAAVDNAELLDQAAEVAALREVDRLKDEFISVVSHELRRPLSSIKGYAATLLLDDDWDHGTRRDFIQVIDEESDRLSSLIENLLDLSRLGSGMLTLNKEPVLIPKVAADVIERLSSHADLAPHIYRLEFPPGFPTIEADQNRLAQVLINLLENAAKYSPPGTVILVSGRAMPETREVEISVSDDGTGVTPDDLDRIFERFFRVDNSLARETQGTGLGLAICRGVVEAHGGRIWAESNGSGLTVTFRLPQGASILTHHETMAGQPV